MNGSYRATKNFLSVRILAPRVLDSASVAFLEGGRSLVVGTVSSDGEPYATRAWGLTIHVGREPLTGRLLLAAEDTRTIDLLRDGARIACTATDVVSLQSLQVKGRGVAVDRATDEDRGRAERYVSAFFEAVMRVDKQPREVLVRLLPCDYFAATVTIEEVFDQTPGPAAGSRVPQ